MGQIIDEEWEKEPDEDDAPPDENEDFEFEKCAYLN